MGTGERSLGNSAQSRFYGLGQPVHQSSARVLGPLAVYKAWSSSLCKHLGLWVCVPVALGGAFAL